jgi:hypothetical protein
VFNIFVKFMVRVGGGWWRFYSNIFLYWRGLGLQLLFKRGFIHYLVTKWDQVGVLFKGVFEVLPSSTVCSHEVSPLSKKKSEKF